MSNKNKERCDPCSGPNKNSASHDNRFIVGVVNVVTVMCHDNTTPMRSMKFHHVQAIMVLNQALTSLRSEAASHFCSFANIFQDREG